MSNYSQLSDWKSATVQLLSDKGWARWTALILVALMMFFAYMFVDVMSPYLAYYRRICQILN